MRGLCGGSPLDTRGSRARARSGCRCSVDQKEAQHECDIEVPVPSPVNGAALEETCGQIRPLIEEKDGAAAEVHHVEIGNAKLHYHERTDEFYYVIDGQGTMVLDDEAIEVRRGMVIYVPRGTRHKAVGKLTVLTICIPPGVLDDIHELE